MFSDIITLSFVSTSRDLSSNIKTLLCPPHRYSKYCDKRKLCTTKDRLLLWTLKFYSWFILQMLSLDISRYRPRCVTLTGLLSCTFETFDWSPGSKEGKLTSGQGFLFSSLSQSPKYVFLGRRVSWGILQTRDKCQLWPGSVKKGSCVPFYWLHQELKESLFVACYNHSLMISFMLSAINFYKVIKLKAQS